jgi:DNA-directed RNA polymerase subunit beta
VLDAAGAEIELKDEDEDNFQPDRIRDDGFGLDAAGESEFAAAGFTLKEDSDDDDLLASDGEEEFSDEDDVDELDLDLD